VLALGIGPTLSRAEAEQLAGRCRLSHAVMAANCGRHVMTDIAAADELQPGQAPRSGRLRGRMQCRDNDRYPYTAAHRGTARRPPGHNVGKLCRQNYVA
jgi:hypothetical protein